MEKDTVLLSTSEYNKLRDFKKEIEAGNTYRDEYGYFGNSVTYISTDEAVKQLGEKLEFLKREIDKMKIEIEIESLKSAKVKRLRWFNL